MEPRQFIKTLRLSQFRSYGQLDVSFDGRPIVLYGNNGAGKTNLLEAVSLLSPGRGLRRAKLIDLARREDNTPALNWAVAAELALSDGAEDVIKIGTGSVDGAPHRRHMRLNAKPASGPKIAAQIAMNWLTPAQDRLFSGPSADRRKFLDRLCLSHFPAHGRTFLAYEKTRSERRRLFVDGIDDPYWFDALEADMAERGALIAKARAAVLARLSQEIENNEICGTSNFPKAELALEGEAEDLFRAGAEELEVRAYIKEILAQDRRIDARARRTLRGVHKSDLLVVHKDKNMPAAHCSTGEQKALLIGLALAHARAQKHAQPLLLLDEVAAHLDDKRRTALVEELLALNTQVFLTGTDANLFKSFNGRAQVFEVKNGQLLRQNPSL